MVNKLTYRQKLDRAERKELKSAKKRLKGKKYTPPKEYTKKFPDWMRF
jgi:hypothetical protein